MKNRITIQKIRKIEEDELLEIDESFALTNIDSIFRLVTSYKIASK